MACRKLAAVFGLGGDGEGDGYFWANNNETMNLSGKKVMIGLSGGINSMAVLCWLGELPSEQHPDELHLFYADFKEHSDDTIQFVLDGVFWAKGRFKNVVYVQTDNSVMDFFEEENMIPHPMKSPCTRVLKIEPMLKYCYENQIQFDLVGYVRNEIRRYKRMLAKGVGDMFFQKSFPIIGRSDDWCFEIVDKYIGWHPKIYDIRDEKGRRIFKHNNCLPCKNMTPKQLLAVKEHYPEKYARALEVEQNTGSYFGRSKCDSGCSVCEF
jgi:3'-phosphoadenosine 5'-phosphosulfate sulfotransferase (PAPS reductase)/FAD synthetase